MNTPINLDDMLTPEQCAAWLHLKPRELDEDARTGRIPCFKISHKKRRFHPRTIIATLSRRAGVPMELLAVSFGMSEPKTDNRK